MNLAGLLLWAIVLVPSVLAAALGIRLVWLRRLHAETGWRLAQSRAEREEAVVASTRSLQRNHLAARLHDELGHRLTLLSVSAGALEVQVPPEYAGRVAELRRGVADTVTALNQSVTTLQDEDEPAAVTLGKLAGPIVRDVRTAGIEVELQIQHPDIELPRHIRDLTRAILVEGVTNVLKHAPGAKTEVSLVIENETLDLRITNVRSNSASQGDGGGRGLTGLRERLTALDGSLQAGPADGGWIVHAVVPLATETPGDVATAQAALLTRRRKTARQLALIPALTLLALVAIPMVTYLGQAALSQLDRAEFDAVHQGMAESEATDRLPPVTMGEPPPSRDNGDCRHYESTFSPFDRTQVFEVCFRDGRVASTAVIPAP